MKPLLPFLCVLSLTSYNSFAMNFDDEENIPLEEIYQRTTATKSPATIIEDSKTSTHTKTKIVPQPPIVSKRNQLEIKKPITSVPIDKKFITFDERMLSEFGGLDKALKEKLNRAIYFTRAQNDIPEMFDDTKTIKKCAAIQNTFFIHTIDNYKNILLDYYAKVTSDTLATIYSIDADVPIEGFKNYPGVLRKYIIEDAYESVIATPYKCIKFPSNCRCIAFHAITQLAVVATDKEFQIWDPKTGNYSILPKEAHNGGTVFSEDGKQFVTVTLHQEKPREVIHIDIWDSITKKQTHTIPYLSGVKQVILKNTSTGGAMLILFDTNNTLAIYGIEKNTAPTYLMSTTTKIKEFDLVSSSDRKYGNYELSRLTLSKKCIAYAFCKQAISNTTDKESLQKVRPADFYQKLTLVEQNLIEQAIIQKTQELLQIAQKQELIKNSIFHSLFR